MTYDELIVYFNDRPLPSGSIKFSSFEGTDNAAQLVELAFARIEAKGSGSDTALAMLNRLRLYLEAEQ
ncbi:DUF6965 family protein [Fibrella aquatica]|uniref:DUF6965 family protein n=1 Tax=Fibrella aquatica TaxID=3242487 RepID=UPI003520989E